MFCRKFVWLILGFLMIAAGPALAADLLVHSDGTGPYATIDDAVGAANNGDRVLLMPGTYSGLGNYNIPVEATITIEPFTPVSEVIIDVQGTAAVNRQAFVVVDGWPTFRDLTFTGGYAATGGAVEIRTYTTTFDNCRFVGNQAEQGGAIYATGADSLVINNCLFSHNRGTDEGGAVYAFGDFPVLVNQSTFFRNSSHNGSSVFLSGYAGLELAQSIVVLGRGSGAVGTYYGGPETAVECDIWGNDGGDWSGPLYAQRNLNGNISADPLFCDPDADVPNFKVTSGSPTALALGFAMGSAGIDLLWDVPFYGVSGDGSGMFPTIQAALDTVPVPAEIVLASGSYYYGGNVGLQFRGKDVTVRSRAMDPAYVYISGQSSNDRIFWLHEGETTAATISHVTMASGYANSNANHSGYGGGVLVSDGAGVTLRGCLFDFNTATYGSAIAVLDPTSSLRIEDSTIWPNDGSPHVFCQGGEFVAVRTTFETATMSSRTGVGFDGLAGTANFTACTFRNYAVGVSVENSPLATFYFTNSVFDNCHAAMNLTDAPDVNLYGCTITATRDDSAITATGSNLTIQGGTFTDNDALGRPGGFLNAHDSTVSISDAVINNNGSDQNGGAINAINTDLSLIRCEVSGNVGYTTISNPGGAGIYHAAGELVLSGCQFRGNIGAFGTAVYSTDADFTCTNSEFVGNAGGSMIDVGFSGYSIPYTVTFTDNLVANNTCGNDGTVFLSGTDVIATGSTFTGNTTGTSYAQITVPRTSDFYFRGNIVAFGAGGAGIFPVPATGTWDLSCNDIWGNEGGDYIDELAVWKGLWGNFSADPFFCDAANEVYTVMAQSGCLPANNSCGITIGPYGEGCQAISAVGDTEVPTTFALQGNVPNPFNPQTEIRFALPAASEVALTVHDVAGRVIATLIANRQLSAGDHQVPWNGRDHAGRSVPSGLYFYRVTAGDKALTGKMTLLR